MAVVYFPFCSLRVGNRCIWEAAAQSWDVVGKGASEDAWPQADAVTQAFASKTSEGSSCLYTDLSDQLVWHLFLSGFEDSERVRGKGKCFLDDWRSSLEVWINWLTRWKKKSSKWIANRRTDVSLIGLLPVDFGWEIITMVNKDPGSQLLFIPHHSHSLLFWDIKPWGEKKNKPWKNILSAQQHCGLLFMSHDLISPALSPFLLPSPHPWELHGSRRGISRWLSRPHILILPTGALLPSALWNDLLGTVYSEGFPCGKVENHTRSDVCDLQLQVQMGVRQLHSGFLFSTHCISKCKSLLVLIICPPRPVTPERRWRDPGTSCSCRYLTPNWSHF